MTDEIRIKAEQAAAMLCADHLFSEVWQTFDDEIVAAWRGENDAAKREWLHMKQRLLAELKGEFRIAIEKAVKTGTPEETVGFREILKRIFKKG